MPSDPRALLKPLAVSVLLLRGTPVAHHPSLGRGQEKLPPLSICCAQGSGKVYAGRTKEQTSLPNPCSCLTLGLSWISLGSFPLFLESWCIPWLLTILCSFLSSSLAFAHSVLRTQCLLLSLELSSSLPQALCTHCYWFPECLCQ